MEPYSEYYSGQLGKLLCGDIVEYRLVSLYRILASKCKLFTDERNGFIALSNLFNRRMTPREMLEYYSSIGSENAFRRMLVFDAATFNTDRHMGNHGVIFDADSLEIKSMAPVFDNNQAFLPYAKVEDFSQIETYLESKNPRIGEDFVNIAKAVMTPDIRRDLINLQGFQLSYYDSEKFTRRRLAEIEKVINRQIAGILDKKIYTVDVFPKY